MDIFSLAVTSGQILSGSGSSSIKINSTTDPNFPLTQTLEKAHGLGCHHIATSKNGNFAASVGFGGEITVWGLNERQWIKKGDIVGELFSCSSNYRRFHYPVLSNIRRQQSWRGLGYSAVGGWAVSWQYLL